MVPDFNVNLLSVHKLCKYNSCKVTFDESSYVVQDSQSKVTVGTGNESGGFYYLDSSIASGKVFSSVKTQFCVSKLTWHNKLGQPTNQSRSVLRKDLNLGSDSIPPYDVCHKSKQACNSFQLNEHKTTKLGEIIHLDVLVFCFLQYA